jgi:hypothetical protein
MAKTILAATSTNLLSATGEKINPEYDNVLS